MGEEGRAKDGTRSWTLEGPPGTDPHSDQADVSGLFFLLRVTLSSEQEVPAAASWLVGLTLMASPCVCAGEQLVGGGAPPASGLPWPTDGAGDRGGAPEVSGQEEAYSGRHRGQEATTAKVLRAAEGSCLIITERLRSAWRPGGPKSSLKNPHQVFGGEDQSTHTLAFCVQTTGIHSIFIRVWRF